MLKSQLVSMAEKSKLDKTTIEGNIVHIQTLTRELKKEEQRREKAEEAMSLVNIYFVLHVYMCNLFLFNPLHS